MGLTNNTGKLSNTLTSNGTQITLGGSTVTDGNLLNIIGNQSSVNVGVVFNNTNGTYPKIYGLTNVNNNFVLYDYSSSATRLTISTTGAATFSSSVNLGSIANSADNSLLTIKQASTAYNNGIYLERGGERNGYFMYIGGALDALTFRRNYFGTQSDVMSLTRDGNVGIGTISPARKLDVYSDGVQFGDGGSFNFYMNSGPGAATGVTWTMNGTDRFRITAGGDINVLGGGSISTNGGAFRLRNSGQTASYGLFLTKAAWFGGGSTDYTPSIAAETGYGINTYTNGSTSPAGPYVAVGGTTWTAGSSDVRKKKNFETTQGLEEILQIEPIKYHFNEDDDSSKKRLGFKAQNILPLIPEMVSETGEIAEDGTSYLTITPDYILPVLVKAIQEQQEIINNLSAKVTALENR